MLGVATLIVVNSVMAGFSTKLRERLHGFISDVVLEAEDYDGFNDPEGKMAAIRNDPFLSEHIAAMTPTLEVFAMLHYNVGSTPCIRPVHLIGVDPVGRAALGGFAEFLTRPENRLHPSFDLSPEAWQVYNQRFWAAHPPAPEEEEVPPAAAPVLPPPLPGETKGPLVPAWDRRSPEDQPAVVQPPPEPPPTAKPRPIGVICGWAISHSRQREPNGETVEVTLFHPGDPVQLTTVKSVGSEIRPVTERLIVVDFIRTEMSEYDSNFVFMPLGDLQQFRNLENRATSIQFRLKDYRDARAVVKRLQDMFVGHAVRVETWEEKQGPLLAAISIEKGILNVLLFMIIAVAGFGILAIFSMIVFEKTRDIGILKALGASNAGVMKIFLGYGLLLGIIGAAARHRHWPGDHPEHQRDREGIVSPDRQRTVRPQHLLFQGHPDRRAAVDGRAGQHRRYRHRRDFQRAAGAARGASAPGAGAAV